MKISTSPLSRPSNSKTARTNKLIKPRNSSKALKAAEVPNSESALSFSGDILFVVAPSAHILSILAKTVVGYSVSDLKKSGSKLLSKKSPGQIKSKKQAESRDLRVLESLIDKYNLKGRIIQREFLGKQGESLSVDLIEGPIGRLVLLGWASGSDRYEELKSYRDLGAYITDQAKSFRANSLGLFVGDDLFNGPQKESRGVAGKRSSSSADRISIVEAVEALVEGLELADYKFDYYISKPESALKVKINSRKESLLLATSKGGDLSLEKNLTIFTDQKIPVDAISEAKALSEGTKLARDLINLTPRDCTPSYLVEIAKNISKESNLGLKIWDDSDLKRMGAGAIIAVAQGSLEPPYIAKLTYKPKKPSKKILALVGKGVTFDSGGLSLKTASGMETMKGDMSGAGAVLGAMQAISKIKPDIEVRGYIVTVENMPSGCATRPGDVIRALNGKSIEVLNTDAEGRLILADCLHLAEKEGATAIVDIATLTGAIIVALGSQCAGLFSDNQELTDLLLAAGDASGEKFWRMPLLKEHAQIAKSKIADYKNMGVAGSGGAIFAAVFLSLFVKQVPWAHLDIAGVFLSDRDKGHLRSGGVGFGVRTLARLAKSM